MNTFEIHVTRTYIVRAKDSDEARQQALLADAGGTGKFEFGGMKITTIKNNTHKYKETGERSTSRLTAINRQEKQHAKHTTGHRDRNAGKECEYINFSATDGV
jgi:hypothetical protein